MPAAVLVVPTMIIMVAITVRVAVAHFPETPHRHALPMRGGEDANDLVVAAARPDDSVRSGLLHPEHHPAAVHQDFARHDHHALHRYDVDILFWLLIDHLGTRIPGRDAGG